MIKIIVKFWLLNISISILLYLTYRLLLIEKKPVHGNFLENLLDIFSLLLSLVYSFVYLIGLLLCSLPIFLNFIDRIRNNYFNSLLTFLGLPIICLIYVLVVILNVNLLGTFDPMTTFVTFLAIYIFVLTISFLYFRKRLQIIE